MAVKSHKLGPGTLKFGETGSEQEFATRCRNVRIETEVEEGETVPVLSGDEIDEGEEETYVVAGTVFQDYDLDSLIAWCHVNAGEILPFYFRPDNDKALAVTGECKIRRLTIGGDVKERNTSDFEFPGRNGLYDLVDADTADAPITTFTEVADSTPEAPVDWH